jgi:energy-coupling factor transporter ATP-binding protein EcfA2
MSGNARAFRSRLVSRLQDGEHIVLYGPRGSGKSTLLQDLHAAIASRAVPCALAPATAHLDDITRALESAYPEVDTAALARRRARARLRGAADRNEGVLLLDHVTAVSTAMIGFLRRLRGGIAGVVLAVDIETEREFQRLRNRQLGTSTLAMPRLATRGLRRLFRTHCADLDIPRIARRQEGQILRAARGRPGWIMQCARLIDHNRYWRDRHLYVTVLCTDTEILLRQRKLLPHVAESPERNINSEAKQTQCQSVR